MTRFLPVITRWIVLLSLLSCTSCAYKVQPVNKPLSSPDLLKKHCELIGLPRVERISEHVWVAIGFVV
jgi:hypothetical protein